MITNKNITFRLAKRTKVQGSSVQSFSSGSIYSACFDTANNSVFACTAGSGR
jgi:hypothetical protein